MVVGKGRGCTIMRWLRKISQLWWWLHVMKWQRMVHTYNTNVKIPGSNSAL